MPMKKIDRAKCKLMFETLYFQNAKMIGRMCRTWKVRVHTRKQDSKRVVGPSKSVLLRIRKLWYFDIFECVFIKYVRFLFGISCRSVFSGSALKGS
jgi:hypothetical protein